MSLPTSWRSPANWRDSTTSAKRRWDSSRYGILPSSSGWTCLALLVYRAQPLDRPGKVRELAPVIKSTFRDRLLGDHGNPGVAYGRQHFGLMESRSVVF